MTNEINLVSGAGISGAVIARLIAEKIGEKVLIIDRKSHIGGNCYDYKDANEITIHKYGSHIFHTDNQEVWKFFNRFATFNTYMHRVFCNIDGIETTIPFNFNTLHDIFPETLAKTLERKLLKNFEYNTRVPILEFKNLNDKELKFLADYIYNKIFLNYTVKQWGNSPEEIDNSVTARVPVLISKDNRYFQNAYQGIPLCGYTNMIKNILNHPNIEVKVSTDFKEINSFDFKRIFYTGSIDEFFDYKFGILPYRSVYFKFEEYDKPFYQKNSVVNYPNNYDFTRIHEYKYFLNEKSCKTVIAKEYSEDFKPGKNERFYPIINKANIELYKKYKSLAKDFPNLYFLGRLGDYKYYDIDKAAHRAFECFESVVKQTDLSNLLKVN